MDKIKNFTFGTWLLIIAAMVNLARWVGVFLLVENAPAWVYDVLPFLGMISGLAMGLVMAGGIAFVFHRIVGLQPVYTRTIKRKDKDDQTRHYLNMRFWVPALVGLCILGLSVYLLPPYMVSVMPDDFRSSLPDAMAWARVAVLAADLIVVAVAAVDSKAAGFTAASETSKPQAVARNRVGTDSKTGSKPKAKPERAKCRYCMETVISQSIYGYNAHRSKCTAQDKWPAKQRVSLAESLFTKQ